MVFKWNTCSSFPRRKGIDCRGVSAVPSPGRTELTAGVSPSSGLEEPLRMSPTPPPAQYSTVLVPGRGMPFLKLATEVPHRWQPVPACVRKMLGYTASLTALPNSTFHEESCFNPRVQQWPPLDLPWTWGLVMCRASCSCPHFLTTGIAACTLTASFMPCWRLKPWLRAC